MLATCRISQLTPTHPPLLSSDTPARWAIVRYGMGRGRVWREAGIEWWPELAPSAGLHRWWRSGEPSAARWLGYCAVWADEKRGDDRYHRAIQEAAAVAGRRGLILACWCEAEPYCHRTLVALDVRAAMGGGGG